MADGRTDVARREPGSRARALLFSFRRFSLVSSRLRLFFAPSHADASPDVTSRRVAPAVPLSQVHEEFWRGTLAGAVAEFTSRKPRGEITLVVETGGGESGGETNYTASHTTHTSRFPPSSRLSSPALPF